MTRRWTRLHLTEDPMIRAARMSLTFLALFAVLGPTGLGTAQTKPLKAYTLILDFVPTGVYVPHYTVLGKGWYRELGLDVKIGRGYGSGDLVTRIHDVLGRSE